MSDKQYSANDIVRLEAYEHIRRRPGMYVGNLGEDGVHRVVEGFIGFVVNKMIASAVTTLLIRLEDGGMMTIEHDGAGYNPSSDKPSGMCEMNYIFDPVLTTPGGFPQVSLTDYWVSGVFVNPLSEWLHLQSRFDGFVWERRYEKGVPPQETVKVRPLEAHETTGATLRFRPDASVFKADTYTYRYKRLYDFLRRMSYLVPNGTFILRDERSEPEGEPVLLHEPDGLKAWLRELQGDYAPVTEPICIHHSMQIGELQHTWFNGVEFHILLQWVERDQHVIIDLLNLEPYDGGTPREGFYEGLESAIHKVARDSGLIQADDVIPRERICSGLIAIISGGTAGHYLYYEGALQRTVLNPELRILTRQYLSMIGELHGSHYLESAIKRMVEG